MKKPAKNAAASIRAKLLDHARTTKQDFQFVLDRWAAERFLFRLGRSPLRDRFVLKGATLFLIWRGDLPRRTRDIDLLGYGSPDIDHVSNSMKEICLVKGDDEIVFHAEELKAVAIREDAEYEGIRVRVPATLEKARTVLQIDIGFGDVVNPTVEEREVPTMLALAAPVLRAYPPEVVIAEKFQAMVHLDLANSRMKDFYDIWLLSQEQDFLMGRVAAAIRSTFEHRNTPIPRTRPLALTDRFLRDEQKATLWREFLGRAGLAESVGELLKIGDSIADFLMPVLEHIQSGKSEWSAWQARGPWMVLATLKQSEMQEAERRMRQGNRTGCGLESHWGSTDYCRLDAVQRSPR